MAQLQYKARGGASPQGKHRVYFACHPEDHKGYFEEISDEILKMANCAVFYYEPGEVPLDEDYYLNLGRMQLIVMPVTTRLLYMPNRAMDVEFAYAMEHHIPVLPLLQEPGLDKKYNEKFLDLQFLDKHNPDPTAIPYAEKLEKYLKSVLFGDALAAQVRAAFDACVFLSYRKKDRKYAQELMRLLHRDNVCQDIAIWYDEFLNPGEDFNKAIKEALGRSNLFLMAVTPNLVNEHNYIIEHEYPMAHTAGKPILPAEMVATDANALRENYAGIPDSIDPTDTPVFTDAVLSALGSLAKRENDDDPKHNFFIGLAYLAGIDVEVDRARAVRLITGAAEAGILEAIEKLANMYETGEGVQRDYHEAIRWIEKGTEVARVKYEETGSIWDYDHWLRKLGDAKKAMMDFSGAEDAYLTMCRLSEDAEQRDAMYLFGLALDYGRLVSLYLSLPTAENLSKAKELASRRLKILLKKYEEDPRFHWHDLYGCYQELGNIAKKTKDPEDAKHWYQKCLALLEDQGVTGPVFGKGYVTYLYLDLGDICMEEGKMDEARFWYTKGLEYAETMSQMHPDCREYLRHCYNRMFALCRREAMFTWDGTEKQKYAEAKSWAEKDLEILEDIVRTEKMDDLEKIFVGYYHLVLASIRAEDWIDAERSIQKAYEIAKTMLQTNSLSARCHMFRICAAAGNMWCHRRREVDAEQCFEEALEYEDAMLKDGTIDTKRDLYMVYMRMGVICHYFEDRKAARTWYEKTLKIAEEIAESQLAVDIERLALAYCDLGRTSKRIFLMKKAQEIYEKLAADYPETPRYRNIVRELDEEIDDMRFTKKILRLFRRKRKNNE